jgi:GTP pyrophosphokinase
VIIKLVDHFKFKHIHDLFLNVSLEKIDPLDIKKIIISQSKNDEPVDVKIPVNEEKSSDSQLEHKLDKSSSEILIIDQIDHINFKFAKCCNPIPGDSIFGFVTVTKGITIHRKNCSNASDMKKRFPYRLIEAQWKAQNHKLNFISTLIIKGTDTVGLLNKVTQVVSNELRINIINSKFNSANGLFTGQIKVFVHNVEHLELLIEKIKQINGVEQVFRKD